MLPLAGGKRTSSDFAYGSKADLEGMTASGAKRSFAQRGYD
jgi:hypothetical protein